MMRKVTVGATTVEYELFSKAVKNINLRVERNGLVRVSAPKFMPPERVDEFVCKNIDFILKTRQRFAMQPKPDRSVIYYAGRRFKFVVRTSAHDCVCIEGDHFIVETTHPGDESYEELILDAYEQAIAERLFPEVVMRMLPWLRLMAWRCRASRRDACPRGGEAVPWQRAPSA